VIGPADLDLAEGSATFVHAVGSADKGALTLVSFVVPDLHSAPGGVPAGTGPVDDPVVTVVVAALLAAGLVLVAAGARRWVTSRSR
jgi:hypothetical protein